MTENLYIVDPIRAEDAPWPAAQAVAIAEVTSDAAKGGATDSVPDTATEADILSKELKAVHPEENIPECKRQKPTNRFAQGQLAEAVPTTLSITGPGGSRA